VRGSRGASAKKISLIERKLSELARMRRTPASSQFLSAIL
jgi:hypothetical protein